MARRRYQTGSLIPSKGLPKDGLWRGRWREDVIENGAVRRVNKQEIVAKLEDCPTRKLAARALQDRISHVNQRSYRPSLLMNFAGLAKEWTENVLPMMKISFQRSESSRVNTHLLPFFGTMQTREVTPGDVQRFIASRDCGAKTTKNCIATLRLLWKFAVAQRYLTKADDWFDGIRLPELQPADSPYFTEDEMRRIIQESEEPYRTFYWILAETGMRLGEACALKARSIGDRMIVVRQSAWQGYVGSTKSKKPRQFPISSTLAARIGLLTENLQPEEYLFSKNGNPWNGSDDVVKNHLRPLLLSLGIKVVSASSGVDSDTLTPWKDTPEAAKETGSSVDESKAPSKGSPMRIVSGSEVSPRQTSRCNSDLLASNLVVMENVGAHAFRHGNCSIMDRLNIPAKVRQNRVGHANFDRMTLGTYTHTESADERIAAEQLGEVFAPRVQ